MSADESWLAGQGDEPQRPRVRKQRRWRPARVRDPHGDCGVCGFPTWRPGGHAEWCGQIAAMNRGDIRTGPLRPLFIVPAPSTNGNGNGHGPSWDQKNR